jgi:hypothetical protein
MRHAGKFIALVLAIATVSSAAGEAQTPEGKRSYDLADRGSLVLMVPGEWREELERPHAESGAVTMLTIEFRPPQGDAFKLLVSLVWSKEPGRKFGPEETRRFAEQARDRAKPTARETDIPLLELEGSETRGLYFSVTDKAETLPYGDYRYMTHGYVAIGGMPLTFTLLRQEGTNDLIGTTLGIIREARLKPPRSKAN